MSLQVANYDAVRPKMQPGDVIAYGGYSVPSEIIKWTTKSRVTHLGVVLQTRSISDRTDTRFFNLVVESTMWEHGFLGVGMGRLSNRLVAHPGEAWWLPLSDAVRARFDELTFFNFLFDSEYKPFDVPQAVQAAIDYNLRQGGDIASSFHNHEDLTKFFCSELVAGALRAAGLVPQGIDASEVTPIDLCQWNLFKDDYYQLKTLKPGDPPTEIPHYNTMDPALWVGAPQDATPAEPDVEAP